LNESEFEAISGETLDAVERALERAVDSGSLELDWERKDGGILDLEFADASRMVINRHGMAREIWVAARSGGFHFRHDAERWLDTRSGAELFAVLSRLVSAQSGSAVILARS
jgi:CyaY protein